MDINRNQYFMVGLVILMLGIQFRLVDSFVLNEKCSRFIDQRLKKLPVASASPLVFLDAPSRARQQTIQPPKWLGWDLLSAGAVLALHSFAMRRPP